MFGEGVLSATREASPKWLEQLCNLESRLLANWQVFIEHRQEVQTQVQEIQHTLQRFVASETAFLQRDCRVECDVERFAARLRQIDRAQEEMSGRIAELQKTTENGHELLSAQLAEKIQGLTSTVDSHHREADKVVLREAQDAAKRTSRGIAEELLRKMEELNIKLGANMASLEEENAWALQSVRHDVKGLSTKVDGALYSSESELRKLEGKLEAAWRIRLDTLQAQVQDVSDNASRVNQETCHETARIAALDARVKDCAIQSEVQQSFLKQSEQQAEWLKAQVEEVRIAIAEQIACVREDVSALTHDQQRVQRDAFDGHLEDLQAHARRFREEVSCCIKESSASVDALREDMCARLECLRDRIHGHGTDINTLQTAARNTDQRAEQLAASLSTVCASAGVTHEDVSRAQQATTQCQEALEMRIHDLQLQVESLRLELTELHGRHQADLGEHAEKLALLRERAQAASVEECEMKKCLDQTDKALRQLHEANELFEQRLRTIGFGVTEQVQQARDDVMRVCRERIDEFKLLAQRQHDAHNLVVEGLREELHAKLEGHRATLVEKANEAEESAAEVREVRRQARAWADEAHLQNETLAAKLRERLEVMMAELRKEQELYHGEGVRRQDNFERQHADTSAQLREKLRELHNSHEDLRSVEKDHGVSIDRLAKLCAELSEVRGEHARAVEAARKASQRQLEESTARLELRIESSVSAVASQCSQDLAEGRTAVQEMVRVAAEKAETHKQVSALRGHCERRIEELVERLDVARQKGEERDARLAEVRSALQEQLRQHKENLTAQLEVVRPWLEDQLKGVEALRAETSAKAQQGLSEQQVRHSEQVVRVDALAKSHQGLVEQLARQSEQASTQLAELRDALAVRAEEHQNDTRAITKSWEERLVEAVRTSQKQLQDSNRQFQARCCEGESRLEALRHELDQLVAGHAKRQAEVLDQRIVQERERNEASADAQLKLVEKRIVQERERSEASANAQLKLVEKKIEATAERLAAGLAASQTEINRSSETHNNLSVKTTEELRAVMRNIEVESKARYEEAMGKCVALQTQLAELRATAAAAATAAQLHEEHVNAEFERHAKAAREDGVRFDSRVADVNRFATRAVEALEQQLGTQLETASVGLAAKIQTAHVEAEHACSQLEARVIELTTRVDRADGNFKERAQSLVEDAERRSRRHSESEDALKRMVVDHADDTKKRCADLQQGFDVALQQRSSEVAAEAKAALSESHQRVVRDAASLAAEVRQRLDESIERLGTQLRESQAGLHAKLADIQGEQRTQLSAERHATQTLVSDCARQQEERLRDAQAVLERERAQSEVHAGKQLDEVQRSLKREIAEASQRVEAAGNVALERLQHAVEETQRSAACAVKDLAETTNRRLLEHVEAAGTTAAEHVEKQQSIASELRKHAQAKSQAIVERLGEFQEQQLVLKKDLQKVTEELPSIYRRSEDARKVHAATLEEFKRTTRERESQTQRKIQSEAERIGSLAQILSVAQEEWKAHHRDVEQSMQATVASAQKATLRDISAVRGQISSVQGALQGTRTELMQVLHAQKEQHNSMATDFGRRLEEFIILAQRRLDELDGLTSQQRMLALFGEHVEGIVRVFFSQEVQTFQRETLDSLEWKLERCVQWLHGANVKLGLNPHGTMFSTDRFREMLFDKAAQGAPPKAARAQSQRASSARPRGRCCGESARA